MGENFNPANVLDTTGQAALQRDLLLECRPRQAVGQSRKEFIMQLAADYYMRYEAVEEVLLK